MNKLIVAFAVVSLVFDNAFAQLEDIEFEGSNSLRFEEGDEVVFGDTLHYPDNTISRRFTENLLRLDLYSKHIRVGGRLLYFKPSDGDRAQFGLGDTTYFDKRYVEAQVAPMTLRLGTFSDLWGYGLALSLFENRSLYFDSELDGIKADLDFGPFNLTGLRGTTPGGYLVKSTEVTAGRFEAGQEGSSFGFSYVRNDSTDRYLESNIAAVDWNLNRGAMALYGEHAWKDTYLKEDNTTFGWAGFYGMSLSKWNWSLLLEYNNYDYGQVTALQNPPTTYREVGPRLLSSREPHYLNIVDEVGYQAELTGGVTDNLFATIHYNLSSHHADHQGGIDRPTLQQKDYPFWETFGNVEWYLPEDRYFFFEFGSDEQVLNLWQERTWGQLRFTTPFRDGQEIEMVVEQLFVTEKLPDEEIDFHDQLYTLGWTPNGRFSIFGTYILSDDESLKAREGDNWPSVESALTFGEGKHRAILFYGRERGGLKCSNGVCRQVQAFSGVRLTLETSL